ncbi:uncharacterized protein LOC128836328 [Malaclemys terrapin pileata]|uniref:uncharacterized protein LOC128836328 n=1 Tax=Malaclemys terrapin pileata TaxID=2991368 RepID=UPI0023A8DC35|nr:uncharacterized protein LOC128836328 [Malaclemys terrapin pileata]
MLTAQGSPVKHGAQILRLLEAVQLPSAVAVVHCKAHQREDQDVSKGNARADREAKRAATLKSPTEENAQMHALIPSVGELAAPQYSQEDRNLADSLGLQEKEGWLCSIEGKILLPKGLIRPVLQKLHQTTHAGREALTQLMNKYFLTSGLKPLASQVQAECLICQKNNPRPGVAVPPATLEPTPGPGLVWQIDFTEFPRTQGYRYTKDSQPLLLDTPVHSLQPGDSVLVRTWKDEPLQEKWKGPHTVLLVTHTAAKVKGHKNWIHHSRLKAMPAPKQWTVQPAEKTANDDLGLKLLFKRQ